MEYMKKKRENIAKMMAGIIRTTMNNIESESNEKLKAALQSAQSNQYVSSPCVNLICVVRGGQLIRVVQFKTEEVDVEKMEKLTEAVQHSTSFHLSPAFQF
jgi:hypothetical protein